MRLLLAFALFAALASPAFAFSSEPATGAGALDAERDIDPQHLGLLFCDARIRGDMSLVEKYFAPTLIHALADLPAGKPVQWQSLPNHPTTCGIRILNGFDNTQSVMVQILYAAGPRAWADTLGLQRTPHSWWIYNVFYQDGGNLRFRLLDASP
jgi:hypothetical protein